MRLDRTISLGTVLHFVGVVVTLIVLYSGIVSRISALETRVETMWAWFAKRIEEINHGRAVGP